MTRHQLGALAGILCCLATSCVASTPRAPTRSGTGDAAKPEVRVRSIDVSEDGFAQLDGHLFDLDNECVVDPETLTCTMRSSIEPEYDCETEDEPDCLRRTGAPDWVEKDTPSAQAWWRSDKRDAFCSIESNYVTCHRMASFETAGHPEGKRVARQIAQAQVVFVRREAGHCERLDATSGGRGNAPSDVTLRRPDGSGWLVHLHPDLSSANILRARRASPAAPLVVGPFCTIPLGAMRVRDDAIAFDSSVIYLNEEACAAAARGARLATCSEASRSGRP